MEKVNAQKIDLTSIMTHNFSLTAQNIVVAFQINGKVPQSRRSEQRKSVSTDLLFKEN